VKDIMIQLSSTPLLFEERIEDMIDFELTDWDSEEIGGGSNLEEDLRKRYDLVKQYRLKASIPFNIVSSIDMYHGGNDLTSSTNINTMMKLDHRNIPSEYGVGESKLVYHHAPNDDETDSVDGMLLVEDENFIEKLMEISQHVKKRNLPLDFQVFLRSNENEGAENHFFNLSLSSKCVITGFPIHSSDEAATTMGIFIVHPVIGFIPTNEIFDHLSELKPVHMSLGTSSLSNPQQQTSRSLSSNTQMPSSLGDELMEHATMCLSSSLQKLIENEVYVSRLSEDDQGHSIVSDWIEIVLNISNIYDDSQSTVNQDEEKITLVEEESSHSNEELIAEEEIEDREEEEEVPRSRGQELWDLLRVGYKKVFSLYFFFVYLDQN